MAQAWINTDSPDEAEVYQLSRGIVSAVTPPTGLTATQRVLIVAVAKAMTGHPATMDVPAITPDEFAAALAHRTPEFRGRIVQVMVLAALVLRPLPTEVAEQLDRFAAALGVEEGMLDVARDFSKGTLGLAAVDFDRNGYAGLAGDDAQSLHTSAALASAWASAPDDPDLAARWQELETLPPDTIGRRVADFYRARGFVYPGLPGSAPPLLAQHDWVHVLADYGTTVESELEVFAFIARANDDLHAFSLLAMVVSLFETGYLESGAGLFEASPGHLSQQGVAPRLADAMRRGALCAGSVDFLGLDWFALSKLSVDAARREFDVGPKSAEARAAGSVGPWSPGGISPYQLACGEALAKAAGVTYDSFGATAI